MSSQGVVNLLAYNDDQLKILVDANPQLLEERTFRGIHNYYFLAVPLLQMLADGKLSVNDPNIAITSGEVALRLGLTRLWVIKLLEQGFLHSISKVVAPNMKPINFFDPKGVALEGIARYIVPPQAGKDYRVMRNSSPYPVGFAFANSAKVPLVPKLTVVTN